MSPRKGNKGFLFGALAGGVLGSIAALLFAPKAGKELRHDISLQAQKVGDKTGELAKEIGNGAVSLADRTKQAATNVASNVKSFGRGRAAGVAAISGIAAEASKELATGVIERTSEASEELAADISRHATEAAQQVARTAEETYEAGAEAAESATEAATEAVRESIVQLEEYANAVEDVSRGRE